MKKSIIICDVCKAEKDDCLCVAFAVLNNSERREGDSRFAHLPEDFDVCLHCLKAAGLLPRGPMCAAPDAGPREAIKAMGEIVAAAARRTADDMAASVGDLTAAVARGTQIDTVAH